MNAFQGAPSSAAEAYEALERRRGELSFFGIAEETEYDRQRAAAVDLLLDRERPYRHLTDAELEPLYSAEYRDYCEALGWGLYCVAATTPTSPAIVETMHRMKERGFK